MISLTSNVLPFASPLTPFHTIMGAAMIHRTPVDSFVLARRLPHGLMMAGGSSSGPRFSGPAGGVPPSAPPPSDSGNGDGSNFVKISDLMETSGVKFGTSGARGLVKDLTDRICFLYTLGFLRHMSRTGGIAAGSEVAIAGDLRPSTERIMTAVAKAVSFRGLKVVNLGRVPSPASALYGIANGIPSIMVTGSHIPADRNGIKFNKPEGEILKDDEKGIMNTMVEAPAIFNEDGSFIEGAADPLPSATLAAHDDFIARYVNFFGAGSLVGLRIGVYEHSAVGRELLKEVLEILGAEVTPLGRSEEFVPVDTEAIREEDAVLAREWAAKYDFDAIVSTDGDSDRPLIAGRDGRWLRGDVLGILVAKYLRADSVSTPVSSNTGVEKVRLFNVRRTRIGSPYVIAGMIDASKENFRSIVSYEANGGFLTATDITVEGRTLAALPTRDSFLPIIAAIMLARREKKGVEELVSGLPQRFTWSDRIKDFPTEKSRQILAGFNSGDARADKAMMTEIFGRLFGPVADFNRTDGLRITFADGVIVHLRPSGNAPELRVYTEADSEAEAVEINRTALDLLRTLR